MSFWCYHFDQNANEKIWQILPLNLIIGEISKIKALSYNTTIINIWLYGLLNVLKSAFILWFDHFLDSRAEICQIFLWYFGPNYDTKSTFWNQLTLSGMVKFLKIDLKFWAVWPVRAVIEKKSILSYFEGK